MASASGTQKSGDSVLTSEDVDHQQTTNRTHDGDTITPEALEASRAIGNANYATEADVPSDLTEGEQVWIESDDRLLIEDGT